VMFKCDSNKSVAMTFYGIPIFDYRLWLIALIIGVLFIGLTNLGQQSNIRR